MSSLALIHRMCTFNTYSSYNYAVTSIENYAVFTLQVSTISYSTIYSILVYILFRIYFIDLLMSKLSHIANLKFNFVIILKFVVFTNNLRHH